MKLSDFDFELPEDRIATRPAEPRDASRLLVLQRGGGGPEHHTFRDLPSLLAPGDLLIVNDSRVLPARLFARKATGGRVELLLVEPTSDGSWLCMASASKAIRTGQRLSFEGDAAVAEVVAVEGEGFLRVAFSEEVVGIAERCGELPLPPYMKRGAEPADAERYQTVFAQLEKRGSVAAPTAGLHFTPELLSALAARGVELAKITLHVGPGTFLPVRTENVEEHRMHAERFDVPEATAQAVNAARARRSRVIAVGTTSVRTLESARTLVTAGAGRTDIFIRPGHEFLHVGGLLTNFHLPKSTLLMLVSAFAGREAVLAAYEAAVAARYRFYSYGDAMLIL